VTIESDGIRHGLIVNDDAESLKYLEAIANRWGQTVSNDRTAKDRSSMCRLGKSASTSDVTRLGDHAKSQLFPRW
jgi:hypothetical protein